MATVGGTLGGAVLAAGTLPLAERGHLPQALLTFGLALVGGDILSTVYGGDPHPVVIPKLGERDDAHLRARLSRPTA